MSTCKKLAAESTVGNTAAEEWRRWEELNPEILALIFVRIPVEEMVSSLPLVCKGWNEAVAGPYCWSEVDLQAWCRRRNDSHAVDLVVKKVVRRSKFGVRRLSAYRMGESGFFFVAHCGSSLKVLQMPMSDITDQMVLKHIKPLPNLKTLDISHCLKITSKGLAEFGNRCKSLIHLKRNMPPLAACLYGPADDSEAKTIADTMPNLQRIELCFGSWKVELDGDLAEKCGRLEHFQNPWADSGDEFSEMSEGSDVDFTDSD
ncbi:hypothetical protein SSX86_012984 [Deinandra increscens subsp. villosa]|uniref:F-box domain-containing protein n=1 Tax=Deinandra increscens subsp. villosa TaxID=3103831 RepID=A0AAP0D9I0_9ASTR